MPTATLCFRALVFCCVISLAGCKHEQAACGPTKPCGAGMRCNPSTLKCEANAADMSVYAGAMDMAEPVDAFTPAPDLWMPCTMATDCTNAAAPICGSDGKCRACMSSADDPQCAAHNNGLNVCFPAPGGPCVGCNENTDCSGTKPICDRLMCRACALDSECATKICDTSTGACIPQSMIALVDHGGVGVSACNTARSGAGAQTGNDAAHAWCDIQSAITDPSPRPYILVAAYGYAANMKYGPVNATRDVTIVGPLGAGSQRAVLSGDATHAGITLASLHTVVIDGIDVNSGSANGVLCSQAGATLTLRGAIINLSATGLVSNGCIVTVDGTSIDDTGGAITTTGGSLTLTNSEIGSNSGSGVSITDGTYSIVNNQITGQSSGPAVILAGAPSGLFWFNTIAANFGTGTASAIDCTGVTGTHPKIQASVIWSNTKDGGGNSVAGNCDFIYDDIDDTTTPTGGNNAGNFKADPNFTDPNNSNFLLKTPSGCTDRVTAATGLTGGTLPTRDFYNHPRPRPSTGGYDVGCQQLVP